jgi:ribosomal protein S30
MTKFHSTLNNAGKVRAATPKVPKADHPIPVRGRASLRKTYNKRFLGRNPNDKLRLNPQD